MLIHEVQAQLRQRGFGHVSQNTIRWATDNELIPTVPRNWRGYREFDDAHVNALAALLVDRRQTVSAGT